MFEKRVHDAGNNHPWLAYREGVELANRIRVVAFVDD